MNPNKIGSRNSIGSLNAVDKNQCGIILPEMGIKRETPYSSYTRSRLAESELARVLLILCGSYLGLWIKKALVSEIEVTVPIYVYGPEMRNKASHANLPFPLSRC